MNEFKFVGFLACILCVYYLDFDRDENRIILDF